MQLNKIKKQICFRNKLGYLCVRKAVIETFC